MSPRPARHDNDGPLARRAAEGCIDSFAVLLARHQVPVTHFVRQTLGPGSPDVDDVVQDAFLRAHSRLHLYDDRWAFSTWLFTIVRRCCLNHVRADRRRRRRDSAAARPEVRAGDGDPQVLTMAGESGASLWAAARLVLTERQFAAVWLRYVEDLAVDEVAAVLECPVGTAKALLFRARVRLSSGLAAHRPAEGLR
jgi:RNA polymerase sigma-70 factor (ECF subfamily)